MKVLKEEHVHRLSDGQGGTVFAVENGKGGYALTDHVEFIRRGKGNKAARKRQKNARMAQRKRK